MKDLGAYVYSSLKTFADISRRVTSATRFFWAVRRSFEKLTPHGFPEGVCQPYQTYFGIWPAGGLS